jgi:hypothetical protein
VVLPGAPLSVFQVVTKTLGLVIRVEVPVTNKDHVYNIPVTTGAEQSTPPSVIVHPSLAIIFALAHDPRQYLLFPPWK